MKEIKLKEYAKRINPPIRGSIADWRMALIGAWRINPPIRGSIDNADHGINVPQPEPVSIPL